MTDADGARADAWALQVNCGPEGFPELCQEDACDSTSCCCRQRTTKAPSSAGKRDSLSTAPPLPAECGRSLLIWVLVSASFALQYYIQHFSKERAKAPHRDLKFAFPGASDDAKTPNVSMTLGRSIVAASSSPLGYGHVRTDATHYGPQDDPAVLRLSGSMWIPYFWINSAATACV